MVFLTRRITAKHFSGLLAFAAGVMAFSVFEMLTAGRGAIGEVGVALGFLSGAAVLLFFEKITPHVHIILRKRALSSSGKKAAMFASAISLHNIPEGFAIASAFAVSPEFGWLVASSIALQDIPEGFLVSAPLASYGLKPARSFGFGVFSGFAEFAAAIFGYLLLSSFHVAVPFALAFSAGAMSYVILVELMPDALRGGRERLASAAFLAGAATASIISGIFGF
ncbi:MAG: ZIP family metal transporter [Candidatus Micrarchaeota archaeon]|nr:ZIP family metal transporter [Candidatus Micrarchaeota archaeon]